MPDILAVLQGLTQDLNAEQVQAQAAASNGQLSDEEAERQAKAAFARAESARATLALLEQGEWEEHGACNGTDPDLFFPERGASTREAKEVCRSCSVETECGVSSILISEKFGIWGGMSERERRRIRRKLAVWSQQKGLKRPSISHVSIGKGISSRSKATRPPEDNEDAEDPTQFEQQFHGILAQKQLELVRHLLRYGPSGLTLPEADGMVQFAQMLGIGLEALEAQRLGPLLANGRVVQQIEGGELRFTVSATGRRWFMDSGMKPMPSLQSPSSKPAVARQVPVVRPASRPVVPRQEVPRPIRAASPSEAIASTPVPAVVVGPTQGKAGTDMAHPGLETYEDFNSADLKILGTLAERKFEDAGGRAGGLFATATGLANGYQNARLRLHEDAGLVDRDMNGKRTYSIEITDKGRQWLSKAVDPPAGAGQASGGVASSTSPAELGVGAAAVTVPPSDAMQTRSEAANALESAEQFLQVCRDAMAGEQAAYRERIAELQANLATVTAERDELLEADKARQVRLEELRAEQQRRADEIAALS